MYFLNKGVAINDNVNKIINLSTVADKTFTYVTNILGAITGTTRVVKGSIDFGEVIGCQDNVYAVVLAAVAIILKIIYRYVWFFKT